MTLVKLRKPYLYPLNTLADGGFVWIAKTGFPDYTHPTDYSSSDFDFSDVNQTSVEIGNVYVDGVDYEEKETETECRSNEKTWYFDYDNQELYVHVDHEKRLSTSTFDTQIVVGYSSGGVRSKNGTAGGVFYDENDIEYLPLISSDLEVSEEADRLVYERMSFDKNTLTLDNRDGDFDVYFDEPVPGSDVEYLFISQDDLWDGKTALMEIYTGYVSADEFTRNGDYQITVEDKRSQLTLELPDSYFSSDDYADIDDDVDGELIPDGYGDIIGAPAFCTNGTLETGDVTYRFAEVATSLTTVYVENDDGDWEALTTTPSVSSAGEFTVPEADGRDDNGDPRECKVDGRMRDYDNPGDIIANIYKRATSKTFSNLYYDTTQWTEESSILADISVYFEEEQTVYEMIEQIQSLSDYGFRVFYNKYGKFSMKVDRMDRDVFANYDYIENISDTLTVERDFEEYATSVTVNYNIDISEESGDSEVSDSREVDVYNTYRTYNALSYDSGLKNATDAFNKADRIALDYSVARNQLTIKLDGIIYHEIYDIITIDTAQYVRGEKIRDYMGTRKIKISAVTYDFAAESTEITGYDITDVDGYDV